MSWRGGRGRHGPLLRWLILHRIKIEEDRRDPWPRPWCDIAADATRDGVARQHGNPVTALEIRRTWSVLLTRGKPRRKKAVASEPVKQVSPTGSTARIAGLVKPVTATVQLPIKKFGDGN